MNSATGINGLFPSTTAHAGAASIALPDSLVDSSESKGQIPKRGTKRSRSQSESSYADGSLFDATTDDSEPDSPVLSPKRDESNPRYSLRKFGPIEGSNTRPISISSDSSESESEAEDSPPKKKRGRPPKQTTTPNTAEPQQPRKRGRPRKHPLPNAIKQTTSLIAVPKNDRRPLELKGHSTAPKQPTFAHWPNSSQPTNNSVSLSSSLNALFRANDAKQHAPADTRPVAPGASTSNPSRPQAEVTRPREVQVQGGSSATASTQVPTPPQPLTAAKHARRLVSRPTGLTQSKLFWVEPPSPSVYKRNNNSAAPTKNTTQNARTNPSGVGPPPSRPESTNADQGLSARPQHAPPPPAEQPSTLQTPNSSITHTSSLATATTNMGATTNSDPASSSTGPKPLSSKSGGGIQKPQTELQPSPPRSTALRNAFVPAASMNTFMQQLLDASRKADEQLVAELRLLKANAQSNSERMERLDTALQAMHEETTKGLGELQENVCKIQETLQEQQLVQVKTEDQQEIPQIPSAPSPTPRAPSLSPTYEVQIGPMRWPSRLEDAKISVRKLVNMVSPRTAREFEVQFAVAEGEEEPLYVIVLWQEERDAVRFVDGWNGNTPEKYRGTMVNVEKLF